MLADQWLTLEALFSKIRPALGIVCHLIPDAVLVRCFIEAHPRRTSLYLSFLINSF